MCSCSLQWEQNSERTEVFLNSEDTLNINITSTLVELFNSVKETWTQDYYNPKERFVTSLTDVKIKIVLKFLKNMS